MTELKLLGGPLGHLEIGPKIGEGGYGVVHAGEGGLVDTAGGPFGKGHGGGVGWGGVGGSQKTDYSSLERNANVNMA